MKSNQTHVWIFYMHVYQKHVKMIEKPPSNNKYQSRPIVYKKGMMCHTHGYAMRVQAGEDFLIR